MLPCDRASLCSQPSSYRGRFAPSPTGPLHLGSLYTALASYLQARSHNGQWLLRIDDVDATRVVPGAADNILRCLEFFGLHWDGPVVWQSQQTDLYQDALERLRSQGLIYACTCSRQRLRAWLEKNGELAAYPGFCRKARHDDQQPHALRIRTDGEVIHLVDALRGPYSQDFNREVGDFVVRRRDGLYAYHLATVIDDAQAQITEVMRGEDLLASTPRQIFLQRRLGLPTPTYRHIPLVTDSSGVKLSKQSGAAAVPLTQPSRTLYHLLTRLRQAPPPELLDASRDDILAWAIAHWKSEALAANAVYEPTQHPPPQTCAEI